MMLLASTWTVSIDMVEGTERGRMKSKMRSRKERERNGRRGLGKEKEQKKIRG